MIHNRAQCVLLIGDIPNGFAKHIPSADHCGNIFEGLAAAKKNVYQTIYIVLADIPEPKQDALQTLSQAAPQANRYLLINMFEEPEAIRLRNAGNGRTLLTDYYLLPLPTASQIPVSPMPSPEDPQSSSTDKDLLIAELETLVTQDDLTGLKNRRYLRQFLPAILGDAKENGYQVTLLLFDLDNFKHYNDAYGHTVGDSVLLQTGKLMRRCCREHDVVARLGGDEFAVVFWDLPEEIQARNDRRQTNHEHPREAQFMAERFRREMSEAAFECLGSQGKGTLTISGGLATYPLDAATAENLFEKADQAMLEAKRSGKNKITIVGKSTQ